jgi:4'-phosphopantetheinyl transferase EntD
VTAVADPATVERVLRRLAPVGTGVAARAVDASLVHQLTTAEHALVRSARAARQAEFATGRSCAHRALAAIGADVDAIDRGSRQQPIWPVGVTGSISHAGGLAAAVAVRTGSTVAALGLDVEQIDALEPELWSDVLTPSERDRCRAARRPVAAATAVFSAKEAAFKAVYPLWSAEVSFLDAHTELAPHGGQVEIASLGTSVAVRQDGSGTLVVTLAVICS